MHPSLVWCQLPEGMPTWADRHYVATAIPHETSIIGRKCKSAQITVSRHQTFPNHNKLIFAANMIRNTFFGLSHKNLGKLCRQDTQRDIVSAHWQVEEQFSLSDLAIRGVTFYLNCITHQDKIQKVRISWLGELLTGELNNNRYHWQCFYVTI